MSKQAAAKEFLDRFPVGSVVGDRVIVRATMRAKVKGKRVVYSYVLVQWRRHGTVYETSSSEVERYKAMIEADAKGDGD